MVAQINLSDGGVPKLPVHCATVTALGPEGDRQNDLAHPFGQPLPAIVGKEPAQLGQVAPGESVRSP